MAQWVWTVVSVMLVTACVVMTIVYKRACNDQVGELAGYIHRYRHICDRYEELIDDLTRLVKDQQVDLVRKRCVKLEYISTDDGYMLAVAQSKN